MSTGSILRVIVKVTLVLFLHPSSDYVVIAPVCRYNQRHGHGRYGGGKSRRAEIQPREDKRGHGEAAPAAEGGRRCRAVPYPPLSR